MLSYRLRTLLVVKAKNRGRPNNRAICAWHIGKEGMPLAGVDPLRGRIRLGDEPRIGLARRPQRLIREADVAVAPPRSECPSGSGDGRTSSFDLRLRGLDASRRQYYLGFLPAQNTLSFMSG